MIDKNAGKLATKENLVDIDNLLDKYYEFKPDVKFNEQKIVFGTSGHRGYSLNS
jgi:phosphoglucomutase